MCGTLDVFPVFDVFVRCSSVIGCTSSLLRHFVICGLLTFVRFFKAFAISSGDLSRACDPDWAGSSIPPSFGLGCLSSQLMKFDCEYLVLLLCVEAMIVINSNQGKLSFYFKQKKK